MTIITAAQGGSADTIVTAAQGGSADTIVTAAQGGSADTIVTAAQGGSADTIWVLIGACAIVTAAIKAAGPIAVGGRELPERFSAVLGSMAAALLAALVVTSTLADGDTLTVGPNTVGVAVAGVVLWRDGPVLAGVLVAAAVTAVLRAL